MQISGETELEYLVNTRRIGNSWSINKFRDMAALSTNTDTYYKPHIHVVVEIDLMMKKYFIAP